MIHFEYLKNIDRKAVVPVVALREPGSTYYAAWVASPVARYARISSAEKASKLQEKHPLEF